MKKCSVCGHDHCNTEERCYDCVRQNRKRRDYLENEKLDNKNIAKRRKQDMAIFHTKLDEHLEVIKTRGLITYVPTYDGK